MTAEAPKTQDGGGFRTPRRSLWILIIAFCTIILLILLIITIAVLCTHISDPPKTVMQVHPGNEIRFNKEKADSYKGYIESIEALLAKYSDPKQSNCSELEIAQARTLGVGCGIKRSRFENCKKEQDYGFKIGSPCFFLTLKDLQKGWRPKQFDESEVPADIKELWNDQHYVVQCKEQNAQGANDTFVVSPEGGFPRFFFPRQDQEHYLEPIVAIQPSSSLMKGEGHHVICKLWHGTMKSQGTFEATIKLHMSAACGTVLNINLLALLLIIGKLVY